MRRFDSLFQTERTATHIDTSTELGCFCWRVHRPAAVCRSALGASALMRDVSSCIYSAGVLPLFAYIWFFFLTTCLCKLLKVTHMWHLHLLLDLKQPACVYKGLATNPGKASPVSFLFSHWTSWCFFTIFFTFLAESTESPLHVG